MAYLSGYKFSIGLKSVMMVSLLILIDGVATQLLPPSTGLNNETSWATTTRQGSLSDTYKNSMDVSSSSGSSVSVSQSTLKSKDIATTTKMDELPPNVRKSVVRNYPWVIALIVIASIGILTVVGLEITILCRLYGTSLWINWKSLWLGQILMFAIFCSYLTQFAFLPYPSIATCYIIRFCVGVSYAMAFSVLVVKLLVILFSATEQRPGFQVALFLALWAVQLVIDIQWLISDSAHTPRDVTSKDGYRCDPGYKEHVQSLVYVMLLIVMSILLSLLTHRRRNSGSAVHVDGMLIGVSAVLTAAVWIVWILLGFLKNNEDWHDPCIAFGLTTTATILLFFMIIPKVYHLKKVRKVLLTDLDSRADSKDTKKTSEFLHSSSDNDTIMDTGEQIKRNGLVTGQQINGKIVTERHSNGIVTEHKINGFVPNSELRQHRDIEFKPEDIEGGNIPSDTRFYQVDSSQYDSDPSADTMIRVNGRHQYDSEPRMSHGASGRHQYNSEPRHRANSRYQYDSEAIAEPRMSHRASGRYQQSGLRSHHPQWGVLNPGGYSTWRKGSSLQRSSSLHSYHHRSPRGQAPPPYWEAQDSEPRYRVAALYSARSDVNGNRRWNLSEPDLTVIGRESSSSNSTPRMDRRRSMEQASFLRQGRYPPQQHRLGVQPAILSSVISITN